jgi:ribosomal protein S18 acetylase RimI-like enzyme
MDKALKPGAIIKKFKTKKRREVVVRVPLNTDWGLQRKFINDLATEDTFILRGPQDKVTRNEEKKWLAGFLEKVKKDKAILLSVFIGKELAANVSLLRGELRQSHIGAIGISVARDFRGEGIGKELLKILISEAKKRRYKILTIDVFANNQKALSLYENLGFKRIGILPRAFLYKKEYIDEIMLYKETYE